MNNPSSIFFISLACVLIILLMVYEIISESQEREYEIKSDVNLSFDNLYLLFKRNPNDLNWLCTLNERFEAFIQSKEYETIKPYEVFSLTLPSLKYYNLTVKPYIVVDKKLNLKFAVNYHKDSTVKYIDTFLKYCPTYGKELDEFINNINNKIMNESLQKQRIKTIENIINK